MRNVLTMVLVLGMVSIAGADAVWFELDPASPGYDSPTTVDAGTVATINLVADFDVSLLSIGALTSSNTGTPANQGVSAVGSLHPNLMFHPVGSSNGVHRPGDQADIVISDILGGLTPAAGQDIPVPAGEALYSFDILAGELGTSIVVNDKVGPPPQNPYGGWPLQTAIDKYDAATGASSSLTFNLPELQLTVVPEPATIALLGIGAVVLYRRKR